ncbi:PilZ domain-containing protein [Neptuniibacter sp. QD37_6]|uniref:PilZ domain-containing protein n=1 Tax=Neptuniibacter sp. QD37_6 TaxID=3398210 RepID=UPI0039F4F40D
MTTERRIYPRINTDIPAELSTQDGVSVDVTLINISLGGMLVEGGPDMNQLKPPFVGAPLEIYVHFGLNNQPVHCLCRVVYNQRQSQHCMRYGLAILSIDDQAAESLQSFIKSKLN